MIIDFSGLPVILQALLATLFTWFATLLGASVVFWKRDISRRILDASLGFSAGIMISASFFSLLLPALEIAGSSKLPVWIQVSVGFICGGLFLRLIDRVIPHLHLFLPVEKAEGLKKGLSKTSLLVLAITIHNIPEGLAVGVAFGSSGVAGEIALTGAVALTIGIAIQNFPEGMAVSLPLMRAGESRLRSFWYGQLSAIVEPIGGVLGAYFVLISNTILPYALAFAAGAMIFVVVEELIPESQSGGNEDLATLSVILGFTAMMVLDIAFG